MKHNGTSYGIEFTELGWRVTVGMTVVCDSLHSHADAVAWIRSR